MQSKWLITGADGQLGRECLRQWGAARLILADRQTLDITKEEQVAAYLYEQRPAAVVHCAAYTNVDGAESDVDGAYRVNAEGARYLAAACAELDIPLVYVSTDYVFDGTKQTPYVESDAVCPLNVYGASKAAGEAAVAQGCRRHYIVRTSWLYGDGANFVKTMLRLADEQPRLQVVADQFGTPTATEDLVWAIEQLLRQQAPYGVYHATCQGETSWHGFAREILRLAGKTTPVEPVATEAFPRPARRPAYSVLDNARLQATVGDPMRPWQEALEAYLAWLMNGK